MSPQIILSDLTFSYSSALEVLQGASLSLSLGWTGVGVNGSGKSTLMMRTLPNDKKGRLLQIVAALGLSPEQLLTTESPSPGEALRQYSSALVLVTHDARLAGALTNESWTVQEGHVLQ